MRGCEAPKLVCPIPKPIRGRKRTLFHHGTELRLHEAQPQGSGVTGNRANPKETPTVETTAPTGPQQEVKM